MLTTKSHLCPSRYAKQDVYLDTTECHSCLMSGSCEYRRVYYCRRDERDGWSDEQLLFELESKFFGDGMPIGLDILFERLEQFKEESATLKRDYHETKEILAMLPAVRELVRQGIKEGQK